MLMSASKLNEKSKNKSQVLLIALFKFFSSEFTLQGSLCCYGALVENDTMFFSSSAKQIFLAFRPGG